MSRDEPWAIVTVKGKLMALRPDDEIVGVLSNKEFKMLFGFIPKVDIKLTKQQDEKICAYIKRRDGKR